MLDTTRLALSALESHASLPTSTSTYSTFTFTLSSTSTSTLQSYVLHYRRALSL